MAESVKRHVVITAVTAALSMAAGFLVVYLIVGPSDSGESDEAEGAEEEEAGKTGVGKQVRVIQSFRRVQGGIRQHKVQDAPDPGNWIVNGHPDARAQGVGHQYLLRLDAYLHVGHTRHDLHLPDPYFR